MDPPAPKPEEEPGAYRTPAATARGEVRERGSRFLSVLLPVRGPEDAREALERLRREHPDATHHCWARRLGWPPEEGSSDAGEPAGTAGVPILGVLRGAGLSDALVVVTRWFGGTKLGKGGLARAYAAAARAAVAEGRVAVRVPTAELALTVPYDRLGAVKRLVHPPEVEVLREEYGARVRLVLGVFASRRAALEAALADLGLAPEPPG